MPLMMRRVIARHRHPASMQSRRWRPPAEEGRQQDKLETAGAAHIVAFAQACAAIGYARPRSTTSPCQRATRVRLLLKADKPPSVPSAWDAHSWDAQGMARTSMLRWPG